MCRLVLKILLHNRLILLILLLLLLLLLLKFNLFFILFNIIFYSIFYDFQAYNRFPGAEVCGPGVPAGGPAGIDLLFLKAPSGQGE